MAKQTNQPKFKKGTKFAYTASGITQHYQVEKIRASDGHVLASDIYAPHQFYGFSTEMLAKCKIEE